MNLLEIKNISDPSIINDLQILINKVKKTNEPSVPVNKTQLNSIKMRHHQIRCSRLSSPPPEIIINTPKPVVETVKTELPLNRKIRHFPIKKEQLFVEQKTTSVPKTTMIPVVQPSNDITLINSNYYKEILSQITFKIDEIKYERNIFYISNIRSGGSCKYLNDIINEYTKYHFNFIRIKNKDTLNSYTSLIKIGDTLIFQYLLYTDFEFQDIINLVNKFKLKLIIIAHDLYFLNNNKTFEHIYNQNIHDKRDGLNEVKTLLFLLAHTIIFPSNYLREIFYEFIKLDTMTVVPHIDFIRKNVELCIPRISGNINLAIITEMTYCKGEDLYENLFNITSYNGSVINYFIYNVYNKVTSSNVHVKGTYNENEIYNLLKRDNIHGILFLNNYAETYSYAITKGINTGLPLFYTAIGAVEERLSVLNEPRFIKTTNIGINGDFYKFLDFIVNNCNNKNLETFELIKVNTQFYNELFFGSKKEIINRLEEQYSNNKKYYEQIFKYINPYAIYFPQFHTIPENDTMFYKGYTDYTNLIKEKEINPDIETPLLSLYPEYNLDNKDLVDQQILIAKSYGLKGFAVYYYWFSINSITNKNQIFEKVINHFFQDNLEDFEVFFMYCNEAWSNNKAFNYNQYGYRIENEYTRENIELNMDLLVTKYFKHPNYKKIDNKPLFFIHHPWEMTDDELYLFYNIGDTKCKEAGFDGITIVLNCIHKVYTNFINYYHHADYKSQHQNIFIEMKNNKRYLNYEKYITKFLNFIANVDTPEVVNSVFTKFNNSVRFFYHIEKEKYSTNTSNATIENFEKFLDIQLAKYKKNKTDVTKIFLINAFQEWGESLSVEPSSEKGFEYLESIKNKLIENFIEKN
jgi:hypothetical protein